MAVTRAVAYDNGVYAITEVLMPPTKFADDRGYAEYWYMMHRLISKLSCNSSSCSWQSITEKMVSANFGGTLMVLPSGYTKGRLLRRF